MYGMEYNKKRIDKTVQNLYHFEQSLKKSSLNFIVYLHK